MTVTDQVSCADCGHTDHFLFDHVIEAHGLTPEAYLAKHPGAPTVSKRALKAWEGRKVTTRKAAQGVNDLKTDIMGVDVPVDAGVNPTACLPLPASYRFPTKGAAKAKTERLVWALVAGRNCLVWGMPGTGKDAAISAFSALTRRTAMLLTFRPGTDLAPWFYTRSISKEGTGYEFGALWYGLTEGVKGRDGVARPILVVLSDIDRADAAQAEWFRILTDSIEGRILGPDGTMHKLLPGTQFVCTANSCGSGDARGRMTSSNPMDASILDRLGRKIEFTYLDWDDEKAVLIEKFPVVAERAPDVFNQLKGACEALRTAIAREEISAEFTHRGICEVLSECEDRIRFKGDIEKNLLGKGFAAWTEGLDSDNRLLAKRLIDPFIKGGAVGGGVNGEDGMD